MSMIEYSMAATPGGTSQKIAVSTTSAQSTAIGNLAPTAVITPDITVFFRRGGNPTALSTGVDQILLANNTYRLYGLQAGDKLAFITASGSGNVYISPGV